MANRSCSNCGNNINDTDCCYTFYCDNMIGWKPKEKPMENKVIFESEEEAIKFLKDIGVYQYVYIKELYEKGYIRKSAVEEAEKIFSEWTVASQEINSATVIYKLWDGFRELKSEIERLKK